MAEFEYRVPTFAPGPVKKEIMQCLRDMPLDQQDIRYFDYSDGVLWGCALYEESMKIGVVNGLVKFGGRIYKLKERAAVPYEPTDQWTALKIRFHPRAHHREYTVYTGELALDTNLQLRPNELEMGRFKLKQGSYLRTSYKDFWDMGTEYDTVNLLHVRQSALGAATVSPAVTTHFAREAFPYLSDNPLDCAFCVQCMTGQPVHRELIQQYISHRTKSSYSEMTNEEIHRSLAEILDEMSGRAKGNVARVRNRGVLVIN